MRSFVLSSFVLLAVACDAEPSPAETDDSIVGGVDAKGHNLDAVGLVLNNGTPSCTGTLISPTLVLTAKHCALADYSAATHGDHRTVLDVHRSLSFRIGWNGLSEARAVDVKAIAMCDEYSGGVVNLGCDVAVLRLRQPIERVTPFAVRTAPLGPDQVGRTFSAIGYGQQDVTGGRNGTRKVGTMTLRAIEGHGLQAAYPTFDDYFAAVQRADPAAHANDYRAQYDRTLLESYEAEVGGAPGDAQACAGDSGGPLLANEGGVPVVVAVASAAARGPIKSCLTVGAYYATFGPAAQTLIATALAE